nr:immunoglobulin light chain junction region [Macaca mulatta]
DYYCSLYMGSGVDVF